MTVFYHPCFSTSRLLLLLGIFLYSYGTCFGQGNEQTIAETKIMFHTPEGFKDNTRQYPLLVDLHGSGNVGKENFESFKDEGPVGLILAGEWPVDSFIVVMPGLNKDQDIEANNHLWPVELVDDVIDAALAKYAGRIDLNRVYMSGISLGAKGVWDYAKAHPDRLAAIVPIAGNATYDNLCNLVDLPVWALHGAEDNQVFHNRESKTQPGRYGSSLLVAKVNEGCETTPAIPARLTLIEGMKHDGFRKYYDMRFGYNIYEWLLRHEKGSSENIAPFVNAGKDITVKAGTRLKLIGKYHDDDGRATIRWTKQSGPDVNMYGEGQSILALTDLAAGVYHFRLTATDELGAVRYDEVEVTATDLEGYVEVTGTALYAHFKDMPKTFIKDLKQRENNYVSTADAQTRDIYLKVSTNKPELDEVKVNVGMNFNASARDVNQSWYINGPVPQSRWDMDTTYILTITPYINNTPGISAQYELTVVEYPLPVEFFNVSAQTTGVGITLHWSTATETHNDFFSVERSGDGVHFIPLGQVKGAGNSQKVLHYAYTDHFPLAGTAYYRIRQTDFDGRDSYSKMVSVHNNHTTTRSEVVVFPNPLKTGNLTVRLTGQVSQSGVGIQLLDALGRIQLSTRADAVSIARGFKVPLHATLEKGLYILRVQQEQIVIQTRLIIH